MDVFSNERLSVGVYYQSGSESSAAQWAECYSGGDLGEVVVGPIWDATSDATNYPKIYAAAGHFHGGSKTVGAYVEQVSTAANAAGITARTQ